MAKRKAPAAAAVPKQPAPAPAASSSAAKKGFKNKRARFEGPAEPVKLIKKTPKAVKKVLKSVPTPPAPSTFIVSVGSYERLLYGLSCEFVPKAVGSTSALPYDLAVTPVFSFPAHLSSLRSVSASILPSPGTGSERKVGGKYLVSGGTDEIIKVWDLRRKKEVGTLEGEANGTITCLRFVAQRNILLAASTDSAITMYRVRDWVLLRSLKGHKGRVNSIDAHPAGRVALSVGQDKMLRMWDLVAGKAVATMKVGEEGDVVRWNTDGTKFAVICGSTLTIYGIDMSVHHVLTARSRFHDLRFCYFPIDATDPTQSEYLFVACEDGKTRVFDITHSADTAKQAGDESEESTTPAIAAVAEMTGHANRVKMLDILEVACPPTEEGVIPTTIVLTTISSDGKINLYDLASLKAAIASAPADTIVEVPATNSHDTDGSRLTCVCSVGLPAPRPEEEEEDDDDEDFSDEEEFMGIASESSGTSDDEDEQELEIDEEDEVEEEE